MRKTQKIFLIGLSFLIVCFFATSEHTQASVNKSQAVVRFYQDEDEAETLGESPDTSSNNEKLFPQTGSSSSVLSIVGIILLLSIRWLKRDAQK